MYSGVLRNRCAREVYEVLCAHPEGMRSREISELLPHSPPRHIVGALTRLCDSQMVCKKDRDWGNSHVWMKV